MRSKVIIITIIVVSYYVLLDSFRVFHSFIITLQFNKSLKKYIQFDDIFYTESKIIIIFLCMLCTCHL